jgi:serine/threonine-protein kinase
VGTPLYMAPEQFTGRGIDHRADLFSAGVIFYELVTGQLPFDGDSLQELSYKICHTMPPSASSLNPRLPPGLDAVLQRALAKSKQDRFASAADFRHSVVEALGVLQASGMRRSVSGRTLAASARSAELPSDNDRALAARSGNGGSSGSQASWSEEVTAQLEDILLPVLGSVARVLIRRSTSRAANAAELLHMLTESVDPEPGRKALVERLSRVLGQPVRAASLHHQPEDEEPISVAPEALARVTRALANWVGPIAGVMTRKTAQQSSSYLDLCLRLSELLSSPEEKAAFLKEVGVD